MPLGTPISGTLGSFNVGLAAAAGFLAPLSVQIDALIAVGLGPYGTDLAASLNAALAAQATLSLQISDPFANIKLFLASIAQLQAALQAALQFSLPSVSLSAELSAAAALAGTLSVQLGLIDAAIKAALAIKIPALQALANLQAALNAGPAFAFTFDTDTLATTGGQISSLFSSGLIDGSNVIAPTDPVAGVVLLSSIPSVQASLFAIITV